MKMIHLIFIFAIIGYCVTDEKDNCTSRFVDALEKKCLNRDSSCSFKPSNYSEMCISKENNECRKGRGDSGICNYIFHKDFPKKKCLYYSSTDECNEIDTGCSLFDDVFSGVSFDEKDRDLCEGFNSGNDNKKCLLNNNLECRDYFPVCQDITEENACNNNLIPGYLKECYWDVTCKSRDRTCDSTIKNIRKDECLKLKTSNPDLTRCVYSDGKCEAKTLCEGTRLVAPSSSSTCTSIIPLRKIGDGAGEYDYNYKCTYVAGSGTISARCQKEIRYCDDYNGNDPSICYELQAKDVNKRCVYDSTATTNKCRERYKTCKLYNDNALEKKREICEDLIPHDKTVACVYNIEEDQCLEETTYSSCEDYTGISKKICESIKPSPHSGCILDGDLKCKERSFLCSEVYDYENCIYYAKASTSNKRCEFRGSNSQGIGECYEEYLRCEDYIKGDSKYGCEDIILHNGKKCVEDPNTNRCLTQNKTCSDAKSREECELIVQSGVSNPDKFVCHWSEFDEYGYSTTLKCRETYKFCSDYRGTNQNFCQNSIQPYNETEDKIDITSKCKYESNIGCQRVTKECEDSDVVGNPVLCGLISPKIQDNKVKYCAFISGQCQKHYKKCENWDEEESTSACTDIIPENYLDKPCDTKIVDGKTTCYTQKVCNVFPFNPLNPSASESDYYEDLCLSVGHDCEYENNECTSKKELTCNDVKFYEYNIANEETCKEQETSAFYKSCILKIDKSGCEEILNISYIIPPSDTSTPNADTILSKGTLLLLILLSLLI